MSVSLLASFFDSSDEGKLAKKIGMSKEDLLSLFEEFDKDKSGAIEASELQTFAAELGMFWDASTTEERLRQMDKDDSGSIDIKEFTTWLLANYTASSRDSSPLVVMMKMKMMMRKVNKTIQKITLANSGRDCVNSASLLIGNINKDTCSGMFKFSFLPSSVEEFATLGCPADATGVNYVDFALKEGDVFPLLCLHIFAVRICMLTLFTH